MENLILFLLKPVNGLEPLGVKVIAAFVTAMYWWITIGTTWTILMGVPLLTLTGVMCLTNSNFRQKHDTLHMER